MQVPKMRSSLGLWAVPGPVLVGFQFLLYFIILEMVFEYKVDYPMPITQYQIAPYQIYDTDNQIYNTKYPIPNTQYQLQYKYPYQPHHANHTIPTTLCLTSNIKYTISNTPYQTPHSKHPIQNTPCQTPHTEHIVLNAPYRTPHTKYTMPTTPYQLSHAKYPILNT